MISGEDLKAALPKQPVRDLVEPIDAPKIASGKVREIYDLDDAVLLVATDRISAFDVVLPGGIPGRGLILTQLSHFWFEQTKDICPNHIIPNETEILRDQLKLSTDSQLRSMAVRKLKPLEIECVVRGYIAGSGWASYQKDRTVCGIELPDGLQQASQLPEPIFTPTTKASEGHDMPVTANEAASIVGKEIFEKVREVSLKLYQFGHELADKAGIILADTKFEFGLDTVGNLYLIDEVLTPDSSRYWDKAEYQVGTSPASFDKQIIRDYLETLEDWNKTAPGPELPPEIVQRAQSRYLEVYSKLTSVA
ncbi:phosphoribosylaminoimidazolesuccinocarboxamide synthase [Pelagicoccus sp. SDUM812003]|uniref:phosphoribosylaminoimidazolesuccinocarboxamide synthase n=1 Tax=Pelagicoccus sp. SDUM812003 TaxID=3041267 RepID=UPI00280E2E32|nr:phosphoribosylaminoimidazolesuccinocarboxamide synthase [Pelagicoccus sp. SDUM812003]MDQ8205685.1 phosphoribosylaminoimidazolesuccinocarboxamide synthase [Pelagicoccus sp. SDUM812003]